jgi:hypothetical protein
MIILHPLTKSKNNFVDQKYDGDYISKMIFEMTTSKINSWKNLWT